MSRAWQALSFRQQLLLVLTAIVAAPALYVAFAYVSYMQDQQSDQKMRMYLKRSDARLQQLGTARIKPPLLSKRSPVGRFISDGNVAVDSYRTSVLEGSPRIHICLTRCRPEVMRITFALAYPMQFDRGGGLDSWDFVFAPILDQRFTRDTTRILFRVTGGVGSGCVTLDRAGNGAGTVPANCVTTLIDFHKTPIGGLIKSWSDRKYLKQANQIGNPHDVLVLRSTFADRSSPQIPGSDAVGQFMREDFPAASQRVFGPNTPPATIVASIAGIVAIVVYAGRWVAALLVSGLTMLAGLLGLTEEDDGPGDP